MKLRVLTRLLQIQRVLLKHRLDDFVHATPLYRPLRLLVLLSPGIWRARRRNRSAFDGSPCEHGAVSGLHGGQAFAPPADAPCAPTSGVVSASVSSRAERLRLALTELGPMFVKFGQALSTRRDLLADDVANELAKLQDQVPPFPGSTARAIIERAYGRPLAQVFHEFDETPLAAASIAQVHSARLPNGKEVVVKVLRPGMRAVIERDLEVLYALARLAQRYWTEGRRLRPIEVVAEYEKTVLAELDLMREAANAAQLRRNFAGSDLLYVPEVYWDYCRTGVMVMERIHGIQISDVARLREVGTDIQQLAENGVRIFFTQVFRHNFFHADMHPGNIFVLVDDPANPRYAAVDFGIVGTLDPRDQRYLADNFLAVFDRDYRRVATLHVESGWVPPQTRIDEMEAAVRTVCEPIFDRPLKDISFGDILLRLFEISRQFSMVIQPQLVLLQKTLLSVEGLGRELYPDLDVWHTASPILREWMRERMSGRALLQGLRVQLPELMEAARSVIPLVKGAAYRAQDGGLRMRLDVPEIDQLKQTLLESNRRREALTIGTVILLGGMLWLAVGRTPHWPGWVVLAIGAVWLLVTHWR